VTVAPLGHAATLLIAVSGALVVLALAVTALVVVLAAGVAVVASAAADPTPTADRTAAARGALSREPDPGDEGHEIREG
jgi:hypothetical protein